MFTCLCGNRSFYSDYMELLSDNIVEVNGIKELEIIRRLRYYTCINCDKRWIYNVHSGTFICTDGDVI